jgi:glutaredoxin
MMFVVFLRLRFASDHNTTLRNMNTKHVITLFTRPNCSICDQAKQVLLSIPRRLPPNHSLQIKEVNIDLPENKQAHDKYNYEVPVGFLYEKEVFRYWVNEDKMVNMLSKEEGQSKEDKGK